MVELPGQRLRCGIKLSRFTWLSWGNIATCMETRQSEFPLVVGHELLPADLPVALACHLHDVTEGHRTSNE